MRVYQVNIGPEPSDLRKECMRQVQEMYGPVNYIDNSNIEEVQKELQSYFHPHLKFDLTQWRARIAIADWIKLMLICKYPDVLYIDTDVQPLEVWQPSPADQGKPYLLYVDKIKNTDSCVMYSNNSCDLIRKVMSVAWKIPFGRFLSQLMILPCFTIAPKYFQHYTYIGTGEKKWHGL